MAIAPVVRVRTMAVRTRARIPRCYLRSQLLFHPECCAHNSQNPTPSYLTTHSISLYLPHLLSLTRCFALSLCQRLSVKYQFYSYNHTRKMLIGSAPKPRAAAILTLDLSDRYFQEERWDLLQREQLQTRSEWPVLAALVPPHCPSNSPRLPHSFICCGLPFSWSEGTTNRTRQP